MEKLSITTHYEKDFNATPAERKHIILLDGTWNDETGQNADGLVTNIVHLNRILVNDDKEQIVRYHRGVGNNDDNSWIDQNYEGTTGKAVGKIVEQAYARLIQEWQKGDRIYIFGFSRGAAAARMLASRIETGGIPKSITITLKPKENKETRVIEQVYADVKMDTSQSEKVAIEFLGVWDTVSAFGFTNNLLRFLGVKSKDLFSDHQIASNIKRAVHLVAIDETRNPFVPSLMNHVEGITHEVWFPGVHSDIGGSYQEDSIAKVSLHYMMKQLILWNNERKLPDFKINQDIYAERTATEIDKAYFHFHGYGWGENLRRIRVQENGQINPNVKPKIHKLYLEIASRKNAVSVVEIKEGRKQKVIKCIPFQYMPFNVKQLVADNIPFDIVD